MPIDAETYFEFKFGNNDEKNNRGCTMNVNFDTMAMICSAICWLKIEQLNNTF